MLSYDLVSHVMQGMTSYIWLITTLNLSKCGQSTV